MQSFDVSVVSLIKLLNKQLKGWWNEMPECSCDVTVMFIWTNVILMAYHKTGNSSALAVP